MEYCREGASVGDVADNVGIEGSRASCVRRDRVLVHKKIQECLIQVCECSRYNNN